MKRKKTVMGLDPDTIPSTSPSKRACKPKMNPKHAPPKLSGIRCGLHSLSNTYSVCALFIWRCLFEIVPCSDDDYIAHHAVEGASEGWEKSVTPVGREWRMDKCARHSFFPSFHLFPKDEPCFVMKQQQTPQVTLEVPGDGSCFYRLYSPFVCTHIQHNLFSY